MTVDSRMFSQCHKEKLKKRTSQTHQTYTGVGAALDPSSAIPQPHSRRKVDLCQTHAEWVARRVGEEVDTTCSGCIMARVSMNDKTESWTLDHVQAAVRVPTPDACL